MLGLTQQGRPRPPLGQVGGAGGVLAALAVLSGIAAAAGASARAPRRAPRAFTPARLAALRAEGRPVFVNMTAAWCVTCLVNERVAIGRTRCGTPSPTTMWRI